MADTVTGPEVLQENDKRVALKIVIESDGSGSTTVFYDASARTIAGAATRGALQRVWFCCDTGDGGDSFARLDFEDSDGDRPLLGLTGTGYWDFREFGGLPPSTDANTNGDINVVIPGEANDGNMYTIIAEFIKTGSV
tara:strand:+ start:261 stop:674 length:414 start_codon:yes stop_codon:yes gene_type:complete